MHKSSPLSQVIHSSIHKFESKTFGNLNLERRGAELRLMIAIVRLDIKSGSKVAGVVYKSSRP